MLYTKGWQYLDFFRMHASIRKYKYLDFAYCNEHLLAHVMRNASYIQSIAIKNVINIYMPLLKIIKIPEFEHNV